MRIDADGPSIDAFREELIRLLRKHRVTVSRSPQGHSWYFEKPTTEELLSMNEIKLELSLSRRVQFNSRFSLVSCDEETLIGS